MNKVKNGSGINIIKKYCSCSSWSPMDSLPFNRSLKLAHDEFLEFISATYLYWRKSLIVRWYQTKHLSKSFNKPSQFDAIVLWLNLPYSFWTTTRSWLKSSNIFPLVFHSYSGDISSSWRKMNPCPSPLLQWVKYQSQLWKWIAANREQKVASCTCQMKTCCRTYRKKLLKQNKIYVVTSMQYPPRLVKKIINWNYHETRQISFSVHFRKRIEHRNCITKNIKMNEWICTGDTLNVDV